MSHEEPLEFTVAIWLGVAVAVGLGLAVAVMAAMSSAHAGDLMSLEPGTEIERTASIGNKQLPLPAGRWEVVMSEDDRRGSVQDGQRVPRAAGEGPARRRPRRQDQPGDRKRQRVEPARLVRPQSPCDLARRMTLAAAFLSASSFVPAASSRVA